MLTSPISLVLTNDPAAKYAEIAATIPAGQKYVQDFDYATQEAPLATSVKHLEELYPNASILGVDGNIDSWELSQGSLGICGTVANIAAYAASTGVHRLENSIYPMEPSPIGLYFVRIQHPTSPLETTWVAIDSKVPCEPGKKFGFLWNLENAIAPALLLKAAATARGGCFDEITNHATFKQIFNWFPSIELKYSTFDTFAAAIESGGICVFAMTDQFDPTGTKITPSGVVYGHAFAAVDTLSTTGVDGEVIQLVRIENPWFSGGDYISDYSDNSPFWDLHPELAQYRSDAQQSAGNYWVSWNQFKLLAGRSEFPVQTPLPLDGYAHTGVMTSKFDESTAIARSWTVDLVALSKTLNIQPTITVTEKTELQFATKWLSGTGNRHQSIKFGSMAGTFVTQTNTNYWAASGTQKVVLDPGQYRILPCTQNMLVDRGELQILVLANKPFQIA